jgi:hypothetical protein
VGSSPTFGTPGAGRTVPFCGPPPKLLPLWAVGAGGKRLGVVSLVLAAMLSPAVVGSGSASVGQDACTTPVFQDGIDVVFGRATTQAAAARITARVEGGGFKGVKTVRDTCGVWKSALRGINSYDVAVGVQNEARTIRSFPTIECVRAQEIGQFQAIFGTRRTLGDLQSVISKAGDFGYVGVKTKTAPCGGYQAYVAGFKSRAEADDFAKTASQRTGLNVIVIKA